MGSAQESATSTGFYTTDVAFDVAKAIGLVETTVNGGP